MMEKNDGQHSNDGVESSEIPDNELLGNEELNLGAPNEEQIDSQDTKSPTDETVQVLATGGTGPLEYCKWCNMWLTHCKMQVVDYKGQEVENCCNQCYLWWEHCGSQMSNSESQVGYAGEFSWQQDKDVMCKSSATDKLTEAGMEYCPRCQIWLKHCHMQLYREGRSVVLEGVPRSSPDDISTFSSARGVDGIHMTRMQLPSVCKLAHNDLNYCSQCQMWLQRCHLQLHGQPDPTIASSSSPTQKQPYTDIKIPADNKTELMHVDMQICGLTSQSLVAKQTLVSHIPSGALLTLCPVCEIWIPEKECKHSVEEN